MKIEFYACGVSPNKNIGLKISPETAEERCILELFEQQRGTIGRLVTYTSGLQGCSELRIYVDEDKKGQ